MSSLLRARWIVSALLVSLPACGGDSTAPPAAVSVSVTPVAATIGASGTQALTATVTNANNMGVTWTSTGGSVSAAGNTATFTAPVAGGTYTVTATSVQDPTKSANAAITVTPVSVEVSPGDRGAFRGEPLNFTAAVSGTTVNTAVTWTATCGTTAPNQLQLAYTAPVQITACDVRATSVLDPSKSDVSRVSVRGAFAVTVGDDTDDGTCDWAHCTLREAIDDANTAPNMDTIYLSAAAAGAPPRSGHVAPALGPIRQAPFAPLPVLMTDMVLIGEGSGTTVVDAEATVADPRRVFDITGPISVVFRRFTIQGGVSSGSMGGGGVLVRGGARLQTVDVVIQDNAALAGPGGGLSLDGNGSRAILDNTVVEGNQTLTAGWPGGGINVPQGTTLVMAESEVANNTVVDGWGGGIRALGFDLIDIEDTAIRGNHALVNAVGGGGIYAEQSVAGPTPVLVLNEVTLTENTTASVGGGFRFVNVNATITNSAIDMNSAANAGGGVIQGGTLQMENSTVDGNTATSFGGGLRAVSGAVVMIEGGSVSDNTAGAQGGGGIYVQGTSTMTLAGTTIDGNETGGAGGGMALFESTTVTMTDATVSGNRSTTNSGGGLLAVGSVIVTATNSDFLGNEASVDGGGLWISGGASLLDRLVVSGNESGRNGGGLIARNITIRNSTFSGNTAVGIGGGIAGSSPGAFTIQNTTVSGNAAAEGGGIGTIGPLTLQNVTIAQNTASMNGGGLSAQSGANVSVANTLFGSNQVAGSPQNCAVLAGGAMASAGGNLSQDATCAALTQGTDKNNVASGLNATLANNGGPTQTHALLQGSAAINGGVPVGATTDQRGYALVGVDDIGAFEFGAVAP